MSINIVLYHPEIPQNTGNIMRTCAGTGTLLHLIEPLGFKLDPKYLKRSGVNYLEHVTYHVYPDWNDFLSKNKGTFVFFTRYGNTSPDHFDLSRRDLDYYLVFGRESTGIPKEILRKYKGNLVRLPINDKIRSLNLANAVAIGLYEALRQQDYPNLSREEPMTLKGPDWIDQ